MVAPNDVAQLDAWTSPCRACEWGVRELEDAVADPRNEKLAVSPLSLLRRAAVRRNVLRSVVEERRAFGTFRPRHPLHPPTSHAGQRCKPRRSRRPDTCSLPALGRHARLHGTLPRRLQVSVANSIICSHLPAADQKGCYNHIVSALDYAVETLEDYISPRTLCRPLCGREPRALAATAVRDSSWKCPFCEFIATRAESALRDKKTDKEILKFLRKECRNLPESFADPCVNYVNEDGAPPPGLSVRGACALCLELG